MVWRVVVLLAWVGALVCLVALEPDGATWYIAAGIPLTVLVGALLNRWWVTAVPFGTVATLAVLNLVLGSDCSDCTDEGGTSLVIWIVLVTFAIPASATLAIGVVARRLIGLSRGEHA